MPGLRTVLLDGIVTERLLCEHVYHVFQTIRCTFVMCSGWKAIEIPFNMLVCLVVMWSGRYDSY